MQNFLLKFDSINGLFGFLTSAALSYDEITGLAIREVNGAYWVTGAQLPERLQTADSNTVARLKALCFDAFDLVPTTGDEEAMLGDG